MRPLKRPDSASKIETASYGNYNDFQPSLLYLYGPYCAFCETPLKNKVDIEHKLSKSTVPQFETTFNNLVLACMNCNSSKGNKIDLSNFGDYVWPDGFVDPSSYKASTAKSAYANNYSLYICYYKGNFARKNYDTTLISAKDKLPVDGTAGVWAVPFAHKVDPFPLTGGTPKFSPNPNLLRYATNTILLTKLNTKDTDSRSLLKRREDIWNLAAKAADAYKNAPAKIKPQFIEQIRILAVASGFWSIWMTVFYIEKKIPWAQVEKILIEHPSRNNNWNESKEIFPGTDISRIHKPSWDYLKNTAYSTF